MPAWDARSVQRPTLSSVTVTPFVPVAVQMVGVSEVNVTGKPEAPPVAATVKGAMPKARLASGAKVMTCAAGLITIAATT